MAWTKEIGTDGLPLWSGKNSIYDALAPSHAQKWANTKSLIFLPILIASIIIGITTSIVGCLIIIGISLIWVLIGNDAQSKFIGENWRLISEARELRYSGSSKWSVSLDEISRVEVGKTCDYKPLRDYGGRGIKDDYRTVPEHEWQTFLFMNDGTRRVIYIANAARDDCAMLAASIREYIGSARDSAPPSTSSEAPRAAGFEL